MTGKTHMAFGAAVSLAVTAPKTPKEMLICIAAAAVGSVISDIDVSTSDARKEFNKVFGFAIFIIAAAAGMESVFQFGILKAMEKHGYMEMLVGVLIFILICVFGRGTPHRSFMHSFLGLVMLTFSAYTILPAAALPFAAAMASHMALDLFNRKRVKLFYPYRKGVAFSVCRSDGAANRAVFYLASLADILLITGMAVSYGREILR